MYKLTLVIPIYNVEMYIEECLDSVINQLTPEVQVICVNDGTLDNSISIARNLIDRCSKKVQKQFVIVEQENKGLSSARNTGIEAADGKYIGFLDSDDKLLPHYFNSILKLINEDKYDVLDFNIQSSNGSIILVRKGNLNRLESVFKASSWYSWARVYKKEILYKYKFTPGIYYEDLAHTPLVYLNTLNIKHIPEILYWYRQNPAGITLSTSEDNNNKTKESLVKIIDIYYAYFLETKNKYYAILSVKSLLILSKILCQRMSLVESFRLLSDYNYIFDSIDFTDLNINLKHIDYELIAFFKKPKAYIILYNIYLCTRQKNKKVC